MNPRRLLLSLVAIAFVAAASAAVPATRAPADTLPARVSDADFWKMVETFSEPDGFFDSDNLVSNEDTYQSIVPSLRTLAGTGAYLGVGPDQNFTYIVALEPRVAFITDVRRGNLHVHLMYKALVELSPDRVGFLSRLFGRRPPAGLTSARSADAMLTAFGATPVDEAWTADTRRAAINRLKATHGFRLAPGDEEAIVAIHAEFVRGGPDLRFVSSRPGNRYPTYADLQTATDRRGEAHGYLTSEAHYQKLRDWQLRNLIVPVVGNFAGPKALRAIGDHLRAHGAVVSAFYASNVERYLFQDGLWDEFMNNVERLPAAQRSLFIRSCFDSCSGPGESRAVTLIEPLPPLVGDVRAGRIRGYADVLRRSRRE